jgi:hypothetical protein
MEITYLPVAPRQSLGTDGFQVRATYQTTPAERAFFREASSSELHRQLNQIARECPGLSSGDVASISKDFSTVVIEGRLN